MKWRQRRAPSWLWGPDIAPAVCVRLSRPCSGILALCGCMCAHHSTICVFLLLCLSFSHHPRVPTAHRLIPYSLNISREKTFTDFTDLWVTSKFFTLKILSCITILYYVFTIHEIFIAKTLKAMNLRKF